MGVKLAFLVIFVVAATLGKDQCKLGKGLKIPQAVCANLNATPGWKPQLNFPKLIFKNVTGSLDLSKITGDELRYLVITHSNLESLRLGLFPNLIFVTITKNPGFPDLTKELFSPSTQISWLSLIANNHTISPQAFSLLANLTWLHIQNQKVPNLTGFFFEKNTKLHELSLRNCELERIDRDAFKNNNELEILGLNFNKLTHFEVGTFSTLPKLRILELHHNRFLEFHPEQFDGLVSVEILGLPSNFLKHMEVSTLVGVFPKLRKLEMKKKTVRNPEVKLLIRELRKKGVDVIGTPYDGSFSLIRNKT